jgi:hypothetical protein
MVVVLERTPPEVELVIASGLANNLEVAGAGRCRLANTELEDLECGTVVLGQDASILEGVPHLEASTHDTLEDEIVVDFEEASSHEERGVGGVEED